MFNFSGRILEFSKKEDVLLERTKLTPSSSIMDNADVHIVKDSERIDQIAYKYYQNSKLWWVIADVNDIQDNLINPFQLEPGTKLFIPKFEKLLL